MGPNLCSEVVSTGEQLPSYPKVQSPGAFGIDVCPYNCSNDVHQSLRLPPPMVGESIPTTE